MLARLGHLLRAAVYLAGGILSLALAAAFAFFLVQYLFGGAGLQVIPFPLSRGSVLVGVVHVIGMLVAGGICFALGIWLCAQGIVPPLKEGGDQSQRNELS